MSLWIKEIKSLDKLLKSLKGALPELENELERLVVAQDENMLLVYSRRCLEVIVTHICEKDLKRQRGTEPLQRIIDKLNKEGKVPHNIVVSMYGVNNMSTFGAHPKEFDLRQVKPVLSNLETIIYWYIKYRDVKLTGKIQKEINKHVRSAPKRNRFKKRIFAIAGVALFFVLIAEVLTYFDIISPDKIFRPKRIDSIAILPFDNFTGDEDLEYFVAGMHSSLIGDMGKISGLRIIGKTSSNAYKNTEKSVQNIATELDVDAVIEAEVMCMGDSICVQFKLIGIFPEEKQLWVGNYKEDKSQMLALYNQVTKKITDEVKISLTPAEKKSLVADKGSVHPDVLEAYYKGLYNMGLLSKEGQQSAIEYFNKAIEIDSEFAPAHAALGGLWAIRKQMDFVTAEEANPKISLHLGKAQELDSTISEVYYYQAVKNVWTDFDWDKGRRNFERALKLRPNYPDALGLYSHFLMNMNQWEEAREQMNKALETDPNNPFIKALNAMVLLNEENYKLCIQKCEPLEKIMPNNPLITIGLFFSYAKTGHEDKSMLQAKKWINQAAGSEIAQLLEKEFKNSGLKEALEKTADIMAAKADSVFIPVQILYTFYSVAENTEKTLYWTERAFIKRDPTMPYLTCASFFKPYHNEPRFIDIVKGMNLKLENK